MYQNHVVCIFKHQTTINQFFIWRKRRQVLPASLKIHCSCHWDEQALINFLPVSPAGSVPPTLWVAPGAPGVPATCWTSAPGRGPAPPPGCTNWSQSPPRRCTWQWSERWRRRRTSQGCRSLLFVGGGLRHRQECVWANLNSSQWGYLRSLSFLSLARTAPPSLCRPTNRLSSRTSFIRVLCSVMHCCTAYYRKWC